MSRSINKKFFLYHMSRILLGSLCRILFKVRIEGRENLPEPPYIVMSNHASNLDPLLIGMFCGWDKIDFMAKEELFDVPMAGAWVKAMGCIKVRRGANSIASLRQGLERIKGNRSVAIFPEGTRAHDGTFLEAKRGAGFIVSKSGAPVIPVYLEGTAKAMPKGEPLRFGTCISAFIGKPIMPNEFSDCVKEDRGYDLVARRIMESIMRIKRDNTDLSSRGTADVM